MGSLLMTDTNSELQTDHRYQTHVALNLAVHTTVTIFLA